MSFSKPIKHIINDVLCSEGVLTGAEKEDPDEKLP